MFKSRFITRNIAPEPGQAPPLGATARVCLDEIAWRRQRDVRRHAQP